MEIMRDSSTFVPITAPVAPPSVAAAPVRALAVTMVCSGCSIWQSRSDEGGHSPRQASLQGAAVAELGGPRTLLGTL